MGEIVDFGSAASRSPCRRSIVGPCPGEILLFTGVRIEHWCEADDPHGDPEPPRAPRRRRRGRRPHTA